MPAAALASVNVMRKGIAMPTNSERREVAAKIREIDCNCGIFDDPHKKLCRDMGRALGYSKENDPLMSEFLVRLADLIEPEPERTCHNTLNGD